MALRDSAKRALIGAWPPRGFQRLTTMHRPLRPSASQAARRRGSTVLALLALGVLTVPGVLAGVRPDAPTLLDQMPDPTGLDELFRDYELQVMNPYLWRERLATGAADLTLRGREFRVLVEPTPWDASLSVTRQRADGSWERIEDGFGSVAYRGTVEGDASSHVLLLATGAGVFGYVRTAEDDLNFEPVIGHLPHAPPGVSVVYHMRDAIRPPDEHIRSVVRVEPEPTPAAAGSGVGAASTSSGPNRAMALFADPEFVSSSSTWMARATWVAATLNENYQRLVGFQFTIVGNTVYQCPAANCPNNDLLQTWKTWVAAGGPWNGYELAHLFTGKELVGHSGRAEQPGRYGYTSTRGSDAVTALLMGHEVGHNFNARHARDYGYTHHHIGSGFHSHSMLMRYVSGETKWEYSSANNNWIRACNARGWSATAGMSAPCATPGRQNANGGPDWPSFDATAYRAKYFAFSWRGTVDDVCVVTNGPGHVVLDFSRLPGQPVLFTVVVNAGGAGRWCEDGDYTWNHDTMFVAIVAGNAAVGYDTTSADGMASNDFGATWTPDGRRRAIEVQILSDELSAASCGTLGSAQSLARDGTLWSCNNKYRLVHQNDGNVVLYNQSTPGVTKVDWATHTPGATSTRFEMQGDGNLVLYSGTTPIWASGTAGQPGATLLVRDDGLLMVMGKNGTAHWVEGCGVLGPNSRLLPGKEIRSCDRRSSLQHQFDGNVVLYRDGVYDGWATHTMGWSTTEFKMQDDGNLVLYRNGGLPWATHTDWNPNSWLRVHDNGKLIIWTPYGEAVCNNLKC